MHYLNVYFLKKQHNIKIIYTNSTVETKNMTYLRLFYCQTGSNCFLRYCARENVCSVNRLTSVVEGTSSWFVC